MLKHIAVSLGLIGALGLSAQNIQQKFLHVAPKAETPPVVDGVLNDACWKTAPEFEARMPRANASDRGRTLIKIVWDDQRLYLGITNYQKNLDSLKTNIKSRDGGAVWMDDSDECYISPTLSNLNYYKFDINSLGVFSDWYKQDAAMEYHEWNAVDAKAASGRVDGAWAVEFSVSWKDLQHKAKEGTFIGFQLQRFEWDGGSYKASGNTGCGYFNVNVAFVYLAPKAVPPMLEIAKQVDKLVPGSWVIADDADSWLYSDKRNVSAAKPAELVALMRGSADTTLKELEKQLSADSDKATLAELRQRFEKAGAQQDAAQAVLDYGALIAKAKNLLSDLLLQKMLD